MDFAARRVIWHRLSPQITLLEHRVMRKLILEEHPRPGVTVLTLNRPDKRNALNIPMLEALCAALDTVAARADQRVLVLGAAAPTSCGKPVFCAGLDLQEAQDPALAARSGALIRAALEGIYRCPCVTIAAVQGAALAGGAGLVAACDIALASNDASFGFPEVRRGLVAGLIMTFLRRQLPERHARALLLMGASIDANRAAEIGLITQVTPAGEFEAALEACVEAVLQGAPGAIRETKELFDALWPNPIGQDLDAAHAVHARMRRSDEAREGMASFLERRNANWQP